MEPPKDEFIEETRNKSGRSPIPKPACFAAKVGKGVAAFASDYCHSSSPQVLSHCPHEASIN